jgi:hypothetical protein
VEGQPKLLRDIIASGVPHPEEVDMPWDIHEKSDSIEGDEQEQPQWSIRSDVRVLGTRSSRVGRFDWVS